MIMKDVHRLRAEHRIVGNFIGCLPSLPRQDQVLGLPMELMSEEVFLLLKQGVAKLVEFKQLNFPAQEYNRQNREEIHKASFAEQGVLFKEERTRQLLQMADKIIEGKRRKLKGAIDEKMALEEEIRKIPEMSEDLMMVQIFTSKQLFFSHFIIQNDITIHKFTMAIASQDPTGHVKGNYFKKMLWRRL